ncbi:phage holin family protein [Pseudomonas sp. NPDC077186]|uniref:phage holin family protein n=1 Tax=Pseudomonas sp. NPDC077186 TaxID=3364421 RepID=UPI0037CB9329
MTSGPSPRRLGAALLGLLQGHLALLGHELEDQRNQALRALLLGGLCLGFALLLLIGLSALLLILYWDSHRLAVAVGLCLFYAAGLLASGAWLALSLQRAEPPFAASLEELQRDREQLLP